MILLKETQVLLLNQLKQELIEKYDIEQMKFALLKNGQIAYFVIEQPNELGTRKITANIYPEKNKSQQVGLLTFKLGKGYFSDNQATLFFIESKLAKLGLGTYLIKIFEEIAYTERFQSVIGKFYPTNDAAKPFYEKNKYEISKEDYQWYIDKYLDSKNQQFITNNQAKIKGFTFFGPIEKFYEAEKESSIEKEKTL